MSNNQLCPRCNRPFAESSDAWMMLSGSGNLDQPQRKDYCGVVGKVVHGTALGSCEKWERVFLGKEVKRLKKLLKKAISFIAAGTKGYDIKEFNNDIIEEVANGKD